MTPFELARLLEYITKNNSWLNAQDVACRNRKAIKYTDASFDSRDNTVWHIKFRGVVGGGANEVSFRIESKEDIDKIYTYLDAPLYSIEDVNGG